MLIRSPHRTPARRTGAILIVVLAMLALFAVVGLSFVLYAESEATSMRNASAATNEVSEPDALEASDDFLRQLIFDTDSDLSAVRGHSLAQTKFGWTSTGWSMSPYSGNPIPSEDLSAYAGTPLDRRSVVNFSARNAANASVDPKNSSTFGALNRAVPYTYPDRSNYFLAMQRPDTGEIVQPSFYRADLFGNDLSSANPNWTNDVGKFLITRPRPGTGARPEHPNFPRVPANADGSFTGDVQNMKFTSGGTQKNDSLWMYAGAPVKKWNGKLYTSCVAPLVLDLSGRVNLSVAGNNSNNGAGGTTASNQGFGVWEMNPTLLGIDPTEFQKLVSMRYSGNNTANQKPPGNRYLSGPMATAGTINGGRVPAMYGRIDSDGVGGAAADPMSVPGNGNYNPFLVFTPRFADTQANFSTELTNHPQTFNPFHWPRGVQTPTAAHAFGMDDLIKLSARYIDPKNRAAATEIGTQAPTSYVTGPNAAQNRALTTTFNVTQSWGEVPIAIGGGAFAKLGPVDLNRPLPDYAAKPYTPANMDPTSASYALARAARQRLATDIFLRLAALVPGLVDGTNVTYNPTTHSLNPVVATYPRFAELRKLAQYAANVVDAIDSDDIQTAFVWNPIAPALDPGDAANFPANTTAAELGNRVVYGTELNRLVINEAYCMIDNNRAETPGRGQLPPQANGKPMATKNLEKKYWIELHNPLPVDPVNTANLARLQYVNGVSPGATATYPVYLVEVAEITPPAANQPSPTQPLYNSLVANPSNVLGDPTIAGAPLVTKLRVDNYTYDATPTTPAATLTGDDLNIVTPTGASTGPNGSNSGYYVLGPVDKHPSGTFKNSMCLPDPPVNAVAPQNAMMYDTGVDPAQGNIDSAKLVTSTVVLRRLANPYLPPQTNAAQANYNPYITVDFLENVPTRDRVQFNKTMDRTAAALDTAPSIGRTHPYADMPAFVPAMPDANLVVQQTLPAGNMTSPAHSFFSANYTAGVQNPGGMAALIHFDRELINSTELLHVSFQSPSLLAAAFSNGVNFNLHTQAAPASTAPVLLDPNYPAAGSALYRAFDLLTTANRMPGIPLGGREPGRVNINTAADSRTLLAALDPQQGNTFDQTFVNNAWSTGVQGTPTSRTPNWGTAPFVRMTADEGGTDRPFKLPQGAATFDDTLFRSPAGPGGTPMLFNNAPITNPANAAAASSLYLRAEPHRKGSGNLTTVSDGFLVIWTVGFFEVDPSYVTGAVPILGKELFKDNVGDFRKQFVAVVDRSAIQVPQAAVAGTNGVKPWETKLLADAPVGSTTITVEGFVPAAGALQIFNGGSTPVDVAVGSQIRVGYGDSVAVAPAVQGDGEWLTITGITSAVGSGSATLSFAAPGTTRFHGASTRVSNTIPGNPGPQSGFLPSLPANSHIVPYFTKLDP